MDVNSIIFTIIPLILLIPVSAHAFPDLENTEIYAESSGFENFFMLLEFGDYDYDRCGNPIPTIESAFVDINNDIIPLENLRVKVFGNSFAIHSDDVLMYAKSLGDSQYRINYYILDGGNSFKKITLYIVGDVLEEKIAIIKDEPLPPNLGMLVKHDNRTFWKQEYNIAVRVYDLDIIENPQFDRSFGAIENGANVSVSITDESGVELTELQGVTNDKGIWNGAYHVTENIVAGGNYVVDVKVSYDGASISQSFDTVIIADSAASDGPPPIP